MRSSEGNRPSHDARISEFTPSDFEAPKNIENVTLGPEVGRGMFSTVHVGKYFGDVVAIKIQKREQEQLEGYLLRELAVLKNTAHENLLSYLGAFNEVAKEEDEEKGPHKLYIITEYCHGGDLLSLLLKHSQPLSWKFRLRIAAQSIAALSYLHEINLLHRDVKSSNILLDAQFTVKVSDFGMAREAAMDMQARMTICGTDSYMAPEMLFEEEYTSSVDVFSFGMVLLELMRRQKVGEGGFAVREPRNLFKLDEDALRASLPADAPPSLVALAVTCVKFESVERPTAKDALEWLQDLFSSTDGDVALPPAPLPPRIDGSTPSKQVSIKSAERGAGGAGTGAWVGGLPSAGATEEGLAPGESVRKTGFLWKRATNGFRQWKKVVFILTRSALYWRSQTTNKVKGRLPLRGAVLQRSLMYRFTITLPSSSFSSSSSSASSSSPSQSLLGLGPGQGQGQGQGGAYGDFDGELSAGSRAEQDEWMDELQQVVDELKAQERHAKERQRSVFIPSGAGAGGGGRPMSVNISGSAGRESSLALAFGGGGGGVVSGSPSSSSPITADANAAAIAEAEAEAEAGAEEAGAAVLPMLPCYDSVFSWLAALGLEQYDANFQSKGYNATAMLEAGGLDNDDLDCLGIYTPLHRRLLKAMAGLPYTDQLVVSVPMYKDCNGVTFFVVESAYKFARSSTLKRHTDVRTFDELLRLDTLGAALPPLPAAREGAPTQQRREALEGYLTALNAALGQSPLRQKLLLFLGLYVGSDDLEGSY